MLPIYDILLCEQDGFVFLAFAEIFYVPLRVLSGSKRHNFSLVLIIFMWFFLTVVACESLIFPVNSVNEVARHPHI